MIRRLTAVVAASLLAGSALAAESVATVSTVTGSASVNQGDQFMTAQAGQALSAGDRIMVLEGGSASLTFADGCALSVAPGTVVVVPSISTCAGGVATVQKVAAENARAIGADGRVDWRAFWMVAAPVAIIGAWAINDDDEDDTVSP